MPDLIASLSTTTADGRRALTQHRDADRSNPEPERRPIVDPGARQGARERRRRGPRERHAPLSQSFASLANSGMWKPPASRTPIDLLLRALHDGRPGVRVHACLRMRNFGDFGAPFVPDLVAALHDPDPQVRSHAAAALERMPDSASIAVPGLVEALPDSDAEVQTMVAQALGAYGAKAADAVPALVRTLDDHDDQVRQWVAQALGQIGRRAGSATPALAARLRTRTRAFARPPRRRWARPDPRLPRRCPPSRQRPRAMMGRRARKRRWRWERSVRKPRASSTSS